MASPCCRSDFRSFSTVRFVKLYMGIHVNAVVLSCAVSSHSYDELQWVTKSLLVHSNVPSRLCACARTQVRETSAHKKTWSAHKCSFQKCSLHTFHTRHSKFR